MKKLFLTLFIAIFAIALNAQIPVDGLVSYYPFNGNSLDESQYGNDGIVTDAILASDRFGNENSAYYFNGESSYIEIPHIDELNFTNDDNYTISLWIKLLLNSEGFICGKGNLNDTMTIKIESWQGPNNEYYALSAGKKYIKLNNDITSDSVMSPKIYKSGFDVNMFHNLVAVYSKDSVSLYFDGGFIESKYNRYEQSSISSIENIIIGCNPDKSDFFNGIIDDVRIYNRALDTSDIRYLYYESPTIVTKTKYIAVTDTLVINLKTTFDTGMGVTDIDVSMNVYPNPTTDILIVDIPDYNLISGYTLRVINTLGIPVYETIVDDTEYEIDVTTFGAYGFYYLNTYNGSGELIDTRVLSIIE